MGYGVVSVAQFARRYWRAAPWVMGILLSGALLWAARIHVQMVDPNQFMLVTPTDERAMAWIRANTPVSAKFLVNGFFAYGDSLVVGADGGWWIPLLAGRETTIPPLTYGIEAPVSPDYPRQVNELVSQLQTSDLSTAQSLKLLKQNGITHVYIGQQEGQVGNPGEPLLPVETLLAAPYYESVYHEAQVWIFRVRTELAEEGP